jgi:anti-sigma-K factor RskA
MSDVHENWADSTGAYLLGALDDDERAGFEAHLDGCSECRQEVARLSVAADALALSVPQHSAPPALKGRLMATVRAEASLLAAAGPEADRVAPSAAKRSRFGFLLPSGWSMRPGMALAVTAAVLAIGFGAGLALRDSGSPVRTVPAKVEIADAKANLVVREDDHSTLVAENLPAPPRGRVYQVWIKRPGADPEPTQALFTVRRDGSAAVDVPGSMEGVEAVLVTHEPPGGSDAPTSQPIISASPA